MEEIRVFNIDNDDDDENSVFWLELARHWCRHLMILQLIACSLHSNPLVYLSIVVFKRFICIIWVWPSITTTTTIIKVAYRTLEALCRDAVNPTFIDSNWYKIIITFDVKVWRCFLVLCFRTQTLSPMLLGTADVAVKNKKNLFFLKM